MINVDPKNSKGETLRRVVRLRWCGLERIDYWLISSNLPSGKRTVNTLRS